MKRVLLFMAMVFVPAYSSSPVPDDMIKKLRVIKQLRQAIFCIKKSPLRVRKSSSVDATFLDIPKTGSIAQLAASRGKIKEERNLRNQDE